jgi:hypothetical protein
MLGVRSRRDRGVDTGFRTPNGAPSFAPHFQSWRLPVTTNLTGAAGVASWRSRRFCKLRLPTVGNAQATWMVLRAA